MRRRLAGAAALVLLAASCSSDDGATPATSPATTGVTAPPSVPRPTSPPPSSRPTPTEPAATEPPATEAPPPSAPELPSVAYELMIDGLDRPVDLTLRPGDPAMYIVEQAGRIVRIENARPMVVLDIGDRVSTGNEQGLLGLAFDPASGDAFVNYTDLDGTTVVSRFAVHADGNFDVGNEQTVLAIEQPYENHNGGDLEFGPDGSLYVATGDGGAGGDPDRRAQDPDDLLGKLLRIDPATGSVEVWAVGLRNPWKFAFDPDTGDLWVADVGQGSIEEVNHVPADRIEGANFGWSAYEGTERFNEDVPDPGDLVVPVHTYTHDLGCSISGGVVYRGSMAGLGGWYLYGDYCSGTLWAFDPGTGRNEVIAEGGQITAVRTGPDGEAYVLFHGGDVYRLTSDLDVSSGV